MGLSPQVCVQLPKHYQCWCLMKYTVNDKVKVINNTAVPVTHVITQQVLLYHEHMHEGINNHPFDININAVK